MHHRLIHGTAGQPVEVVTDDDGPEGVSRCWIQVHAVDRAIGEVNGRSKSRTTETSRYRLLEKFDSVGIAISPPNLVESAYLVRADYSNRYHSAKHDDRLNRVGPNNRFQATLKNTETRSSTFFSRVGSSVDGTRWRLNGTILVLTKVV